MLAPGAEVEMVMGTQGDMNRAPQDGLSTTGTRTDRLINQMMKPGEPRPGSAEGGSVLHRACGSDPAGFSPITAPYPAQADGDATAA